MKTLRNVVAGLLVGFGMASSLATLLYGWFHTDAWDTGPPAPDQASGAIHPVNKHGTMIYWTAAELRAARLESWLGWILLAIVVAGLIIQPKSNLRREGRGSFPVFFSVRHFWDPDDPRRLFAVTGIAAALFGGWFAYFRLPALIVAYGEVGSW